jgi:uncharacterized protein DUF3606
VWRGRQRSTFSKKSSFVAVSEERCWCDDTCQVARNLFPLRGKILRPAGEICRVRLSCELRERVVGLRVIARMDNVKDRQPQDPSRINIRDEWEVYYWTKKLRVSRDELRRLVATHGNSVEKVREAIAKKL